MFRQGIGNGGESSSPARFHLNPFSERPSDDVVDNRFQSPGKRLFEAILGNKLLDVKILLEKGADPNASLAIIRSQKYSDKDHKTNGLVNQQHPNNHQNHRNNNKKNINNNAATYHDLDNVFLWKKLFGETPTPVHIAVMNVYHCNHNYRDLERALKILKLLLKHGGDVSHSSDNLFLRRKMIATNPLDLALGVQRMTLWMNIEKAETAMIKAVEIMRQHYERPSTTTSHKNGNGTVRPPKSSVPFELVSLKLLDQVEHLLFSPHHHHNNHHTHTHTHHYNNGGYRNNQTRPPDIVFVCSDIEYSPVIVLQEKEEDEEEESKKANEVSGDQASLVRV